MRILLTGKDGQLGFELQRALAPLGEVIALDRAQCDLADPQAIESTFLALQPDLLVNAAAYTAVERAEAEPAVAFAVNAMAPGIFGKMAARAGIPIVHYSTDYVFDGASSRPYVEGDAPHPINIYGQSKLAGEQALLASGASCLILRTSWLLGVHGENFAKTMLRLAQTRDSLTVIADQFGAPTPADLVADVTAHLVRQMSLGGPDFPFGIYHLTAGGEASWHELAAFVIAHARRVGLPLQLQADKLLAVSSAAYPAAARRPANSRLDTSRLRATFALELPDWRSGVAHILEQII